MPEKHKLYFVHSQPEPEPEPEPEQEEPQDLYENVDTPSETQPGFQTYDTAEGQIQEEPAQKEPEQLAEATGYDEEEQLYDNAEPVQVMYDPLIWSLKGWWRRRKLRPISHIAYVTAVSNPGQLIKLNSN